MFKNIYFSQKSEISASVAVTIFLKSTHYWTTLQFTHKPILEIQFHCNVQSAGVYLFTVMLYMCRAHRSVCRILQYNPPEHEQQPGGYLYRNIHKKHTLYIHVFNTIFLLHQITFMLSLVMNSCSFISSKMFKPFSLLSLNPVRLQT